jgi:hypothetical protein
MNLDFLKEIFKIFSVDLEISTNLLRGYFIEFCVPTFWTGHLLNNDGISKVITSYLLLDRGRVVTLRDEDDGLDNLTTVEAHEEFYVLPGGENVAEQPKCLDQDPFVRVREQVEDLVRSEGGQDLSLGALFTNRF